MNIFNNSTWREKEGRGMLNQQGLVMIYNIFLTQTCFCIFAALCSSSRDCIGDQLCIQGVCQPTCKSNDSCPQFQYCQNSICVQEVKCRSDGDCGDSEKCLENSVGQAECVNVCNGLVLCGRNAECTARNHEAVCTCKSGYHGNPKDERIGCELTECTRSDQCSGDKLCEDFKCKIACLTHNPCGENALCSAENHRQVCYCQPGYTGNPQASCQLIDLCERRPCGPNAQCTNARGSYKCSCPLGLVGDPYVGGCQPPAECSKDQDCPDAAKCVQSNGIPKCKGACENAVCGPNAECVAKSHQAACKCQNGYDGNPEDQRVGCRPKPVPCQANADCLANTYCYAEICPPCQSDKECSLTEQCLKGQCQNPCDRPGACGMNAECHILNHQKSCSCPVGFTGNHSVECVRIPVACDSNADCSRNNTCRDGMCLPACVSSDNECALNEKCLKGNCMLYVTKKGQSEHKMLFAVTCRVDNDCFLGHICLHNMCVFGCHADEDCSASETCRDNRCANPCAPNPCGPNAVCTVSNQRASCSCSPGLVPNPTAKVACVRAPAPACSENRDCPSGNKCLAGTCLPVCSSEAGCLGNERCDVGAGVCRPLCHRDQDCRSGEMCEGLVCRIGCRSDTGCPVGKACVNSQCTDMLRDDPCNTNSVRITLFLDLCSSPTACGTNAACTMQGHQKACSCPAPLTGDPRVSCHQPVTSCQAQQECATGQKCQGSLCQTTCSRDANCLSDERCVNGICQTVCNSDAKCGYKHICENRLCVPGCRSDTVCADNQACIEKQCKNPCEGSTICGSCALCQVVNHGIQCSCPTNFFGNPLIGCSRPPVRCGSPDCSDCDVAGYCTKSCQASKDCACGEVCANGKCRAKCSGASVCAQGHICDNGVCVAGCHAHKDCPSDKACMNQQCSNPCAEGVFPCGKNALCRVSEHRAVCLCPDGFQGEPTQTCSRYECARDEDCEPSKMCGKDKVCRNPCLEAGSCGKNAQCRVIQRQAQCSCPPGYFGNPVVECKQGANEACLRNPCGENAKCRDTGGAGYECTCMTGCSGDAYQGCVCDKCQDKECGVNAACRMTSGGQSECYCPSQYPAYKSRPQVIVEPRAVGRMRSACAKVWLLSAENVCANDYDCPNEKACVNKQCIDPCTLRGACGTNALCRPVLHKPRCSCPQCYVGMPHEVCTPEPKCEKTVPRPNQPVTGCMHDDDCADHLACNRATKDCQDPCRAMLSFACDANKKCEVRRHKPMCVCKSGFVVNDMGELTCAPEHSDCSHNQECASNLACIEKKCQNPCTALHKPPCSADKTCDVLDHKPVCICTRDCNPTLSICLRDNGCLDHLACRGYRCIDPCSNVTCTDDAPCYVEEHKPVCKFCPTGYVTDSKYGCLKGNAIKESSYL
ncbi:hypothetical protein PR048_009627 [Dryococelus australis]|uniref:EGF-like domain-containing protein n=1 Tax=Dryococelus australis TaxID=614101 RepID=A0ABQ9I0E3_9NEOP|nr:hypothetical protein PR048_009627 [Dryococelus australis]